MKKLLSSFILCVIAIFSLSLTACGDDKNGTYYPSNEEMKVNLKNSGYAVEVYDDINYHEFFVTFSSLYEGTLVKAVKDTDYIYFFRLKNSYQCDIVYDILNENCENYNSLVKIENDEKFGNIVYCGTENAVNTAGIRVVSVKVDVKA